MWDVRAMVNFSLCKCRQICLHNHFWPASLLSLILLNTYQYTNINHSTREREIEWKKWKPSLWWLTSHNVNVHQYVRKIISNRLADFLAHSWTCTNHQTTHSITISFRCPLYPPAVHYFLFTISCSLFPHTVHYFLTLNPYDRMTVWPYDRMTIPC
jgi:hypothetical protein